MLQAIVISAYGASCACLGVFAAQRKSDCAIVFGVLAVILGFSSTFFFI